MRVPEKQSTGERGAGVQASTSTGESESQFPSRDTAQEDTRPEDEIAPGNRGVDGTATTSLGPKTTTDPRRPPLSLLVGVDQLLEATVDHLRPHLLTPP